EMVSTKASESAEIRARLDHPVIDGDGHFTELGPIFSDYLRQVGGSRMVDRYRSYSESTADFAATVMDPGKLSRLSPEERRDKWVTALAGGPPPSSARDRASAFLPRLLYDRMDELGLDFSVLYPSAGLVIPDIQDEELRRVACRALNTMNADLYREYA